MVVGKTLPEDSATWTEKFLTSPFLILALLLGRVGWQVMRKAIEQHHFQSLTASCMSRAAGDSLTCTYFYC